MRLDINPKLMNNMMARIRVLVPPLHEQVQIASHLERVLKPLEQSTNQTRVQIALLQEWNARLVADVVAGRVDVRETAATLPDESSDVGRDEQPELEEDRELEEALA